MVMTYDMYQALLTRYINGYDDLLDQHTVPCASSHSSTLSRVFFGVNLANI